MNIKNIIEVINSKDFINKTTAIMAGHFMLYFNEEEKELVPMIYQEIQNQYVKKRSKLLAGDFPVKSLKLGIEIANHYKGISKLVLLVNDHKFQDESFQPNARDLINNNAGILRRQFFEKYAINLPDIFQTIFKKNKLNYYDLFLFNDDSKRQKQDILPKNSIYFSEQRLRNRFDNTIRRMLKNNNRFHFEESNLYFKQHETTICLTENGKCGCSGEIIQFIYKLYDLKFENLILLSPNECYNQIKFASKAVINGLNLPVTIFLIKGIGGAGINIDSKNAIEMEIIS